jgi:hypothetical protein
MERGGKKTAAAIHQEMAHEVNQLLSRIYAQRRKCGRMDLEAVETAWRTALQQAGAAALSQLLQYPASPAEQRGLPCPCGHHADYQGLRSKPVLTVVGPARVARPYYLCARCHWRDAKLGCVFTQTTMDKKGHPIRDADSTTYVGRHRERRRVW